MKVEIILEGKPDQIKSIVGLAVEESLLVGYTSLHEDNAERDLPHHAKRKRALDAPFKPGDKVYAKWNNSHYRIPRLSTGQVTEIIGVAQGYAVNVSWDDPTLEPCSVAASILAKGRPVR